MALTGQLVTVITNFPEVNCELIGESVESPPKSRVYHRHILRTLSAICKSQVRRLLRRTKGIEHLGPITPKSEGKKDA